MLPHQAFLRLIACMRAHTHGQDQSLLTIPSRPPLNLTRTALSRYFVRSRIVSFFFFSLSPPPCCKQSGKFCLLQHYMWDECKMYIVETLVSASPFPHCRSHVQQINDKLPPTHYHVLSTWFIRVFCTQNNMFIRCMFIHKGTFVVNWPWPFI